ncbi:MULTISPECIES: helix-turn-helix domain-containing protein [unclassified Snodgrassella]|uniref:helix-turn-helix domain-containing protein n=1 Tax=unclassified Snodgrassella TaxID=2625236 RepID=UPI0018DC639C|nr:MULTISPECIES: helix-turn-helix domain-containing protein [unclassified Snodgrassella]MBI0097244.1 terminase [Snodgrassella sp. W8134]MBI0101023.1 terminase [Snodgrassella sp. W8135]
MARPTDYRQEYAEQARKLCLLGFTDKQLADFFDVNESTINRWKQKYPEFCKSIKSGKVVADAQVAESLFKRAMGMEVTEVEVRDDGKKKVKRVTKKHIPPDPTAQIFWLKNRQPELWRDKPTVENSVQEAVPVQIVVQTVDAGANNDNDHTDT